jgi:hypothetical protein
MISHLTFTIQDTQSVEPTSTLDVLGLGLSSAVNDEAAKGQCISICSIPLQPLLTVLTLFSQSNMSVTFITRIQKQSNPPCQLHRPSLPLMPPLSSSTCAKMRQILMPLERSWPQHLSSLTKMPPEQ